MRFFIVTLLLFVGNIILAVGQNYSLKGTVLDRDTYIPLSGVEVQVVAAGGKLLAETQAQTDNTGHFSLSADMPIRRLFFSREAYYSKEIKIDSGDVFIITYLQSKTGLPVGTADTTTVTTTDIDNKINLLPPAEVVVRGYETYRRLLQTPASMVVIDRKDLMRAGENSLLTAFNSQPGMRLEERSPESYRFAIRGSNLLRSSFGVRNVKVYFNGVPLTDARGITPINLLDPALLNRAEIIKGPAGSMYGAGNGGVINLNSIQLDPNTQYRLRSDFMAGAYGLLRGGVEAAMKPGQHSSIQIQYRHQQSEGYREHTASNRDLWAAMGQADLGKRHSLSAFIWYSRLNYQIPGGLTLSEWTDNPRQARPENIFQKAAFDTKNTFSGLHYGYKHAAFTADVSVFAALSTIENPFTTNYKAEQHSGTGVRAVLGKTFQVGKKNNNDAGIKTLIQMGGEWQGAWLDARNYGNVGGVRDTLNFSDEISPFQTSLFIQNEWYFPQNWSLSASASWAQQRYHIFRTNFDNSSSDNRIAFTPAVLPRLAVLKSLGKQQQAAWYASLSAGFSPPTLDEIRSGNNAVNTTLQAEKGINYETGMRATLLNRKLYADITLFWLHLSNAMTRYTDSTNTVVYRNAGSTDNRGIEAALRYEWTKNNKAVKWHLNSWLSYTFNDFWFDEYEDKGVVLSGNQLTGTARHILAAGTDFSHQIGFYANITVIYTDKIPLDDANTVYSDPYTLLKVQVGYRHILKRQFSFEIFAGADNLLNEKYSLGNDLNAFQARYFQPAANRNFYGGLKIGWRK